MSFKPISFFSRPY